MTNTSKVSDENCDEGRGREKLRKRRNGRRRKNVRVCVCEGERKTEIVERG